MYIKYNHNPLGNTKIGDCVVRAIGKATGKTWDETYDILSKIGKEIKMLPNSNKLFEPYLTARYKKVSLGRILKGAKRMKVEDFCVLNPKGTYILSISNHIVAVLNGSYYDTFDCGKGAIYKYWIIKD